MVIFPIKDFIGITVGEDAKGKTSKAVNFTTDNIKNWIRTAIKECYDDPKYMPTVAKNIDFAE